MKISLNWPLQGDGVKYEIPCLNHKRTIIVHNKKEKEAKINRVQQN